MTPDSTSGLGFLNPAPLRFGTGMGKRYYVNGTGLGWGRLVPNLPRVAIRNWTWYLSLVSSPRKEEDGQKHMNKLVSSLHNWNYTQVGWQ